MTFQHQPRAAELLAVVEPYLPREVKAAALLMTSLIDDRDMELERFLTEADPVGRVVDFAGTAAPVGWLACDGSLVKRNTYSGLFAVIGTTFGVGDTTTTFALPTISGDDADTIKIIRA